MTNKKLDLTALLAAQTQGRFFGPQEPEAYDKPTNIVIAGNGVFRVRKTPVALFKEKMVDIPAASKIPGLSDMQEGPELLVPKIPLKYLLMILSFYRDVHRKDKTEASSLFFWNHNEEPLPEKYTDGTEVKGLTEDGQLVLYCPQQKNSSGLTEFHQDGMVNYLRDHCTPLCEIHSHHVMDAFWSSTDNANENMTQFYGVWGKIFDEKPKFLFRWVSGDKKIDIDPSILFDIPQVTTTIVSTTTFPIEGMEPIVQEISKQEPYQGPWTDIEYPSDWMGQHQKSVYSYAKTNYGKPSNHSSSRYDYGYPYDFGELDLEFDEQGFPTSGTAKSASFSTTKGINGHEDDVKKNEKIGEVEESDARTAVEIFIDKNIGADTTIGEAEEVVREFVQQVIYLGYDSVIMDVVKDSHYDEIAAGLHGEPWTGYGYDY